MRTFMRGFQLLAALFFLLLPLSGKADAPRPWQMYFQEPVTPVMEHLYDFHNLLLMVEGGIVVVVAALLVFVIIRFRASKNPIPSKRAHNTFLEVIWTAIPILILIVIAFPSFRLLYMMDVTPK